MLPDFYRTGPGRTALRELVVARAAFDAFEVELVAMLRAQGCSWVEIAGILGMTPQGAAKRHREAALSRAERDGGREPFIPERPEGRF